MTSFRDITIPGFLDTSANDLIRDFFNPMLAAAVSYDRGVGYFSSGWLRIAAQGMTAFAEHGGRARWVTSPILDKSDWEALVSGDIARSDYILHNAMERSVADLAVTLDEDVRSALAWMIADGVVDFRLAIPRNLLDQGNFHDKFGIFTDSSGDRVSFNGSYNDSIQGTRNYESIKVFCAWIESFAVLVQADNERFERLWCNLDQNVRVYTISDAIRLKILQLRSQDRPYRHAIRDEQVLGEFQLDYGTTTLQLPEDLVLREYQLSAIDNWFSANCKGLLEMATGSGKTITALSASVRLFERERRLAVIIAVPYKHLVDQWESEAKPFGYHGIKAYVSTEKWRGKLTQAISDYNAGYRDLLSVFVTHDTFSTPEFQSCIAALTAPVLLIADEVHHLGSSRSREVLPSNVACRLALSATPDRWFDDFGTQRLRDYFGTTVSTFSMADAIGTCLTPYRYYPRLVALSDDEMLRYSDLSAKIGRLAAREDNEAQDMIKTLLMRRAALLNTAVNKVPALRAIIEREPDLHHALFYCAPGQIEEVTRLLGWELGLRVHTFTAQETQNERAQLLADFDTGDIQGLVAMRCLDEGVDVPATRTAYILASSSNPREFIQRRGRVLRRYPGKEFAEVYDLLAVPPEDWQPTPDDPVFASERSMVRRELTRLSEFAEHALNKHEALDVVWDLARRYGLQGII